MAYQEYKEDLDRRKKNAESVKTRLEEWFRFYVDEPTGPNYDRLAQVINEYDKLVWPEDTERGGHDS